MLNPYENIKKIRLKKGWTQTQVAEKVGYTSKSMVAKIEKGEVDLPLSKITAFSEAFSCTESELLGWDNAPLRAYLLDDELKMMEAIKASPKKDIIISFILDMLSE